MLSNQLMETLHQLDRQDRLRVVQLLVNDLANESDDKVITQVLSGTTYDIWSPFDAPEAANALLEFATD